MKTIGMLGGMSWESTASYYKLINEEVKSILGGLHSAKICLYSVDFSEIEKHQHNGNWNATAKILTESAKSIEAGGADFLLICTNTMHKVASDIEQTISIPLLHIADATAEVLIGNNIKQVGLLGTQFTMEQDFYIGRLRDKYGINVLTPDQSERSIIHKAIYSELCLGIINDNSKASFLKIIDNLKQKGAEAVILGCTEIALLVQQQHTDVPLYDTTEIHAKSAVKFALEK